MIPKTAEQLCLKSLSSSGFSASFGMQSISWDLGNWSTAQLSGIYRLLIFMLYHYGNLDILMSFIYYSLNQMLVLFLWLMFWLIQLDSRSIMSKTSTPAHLMDSLSTLVLLLQDKIPTSREHKYEALLYPFESACRDADIPKSNLSSKWLQVIWNQYGYINHISFVISFNKVFIPVTIYSDKLQL